MKRTILALALLGCSSSPPSSAPADSAPPLSLEDCSAAVAIPADAAPPPARPMDLATLDLAPPSPCVPVACRRGETCGTYTNTTGDVEYLTCCTAVATMRCHDSLGLGESCSRSVCAPGATCANGLPNGGAMPLVLACCISPASSPVMRCSAD